MDATFREMYANPKATLATAEDLVASLDRAGVDMAVAVGIGWEDPRLAQAANDYIAEAVSRFPSRLVGFCGVNPLWGDAALAEVERCARAGLRGIGELHPDTQGFFLDDRDVMGPLMDLALKLGIPVLTHASEPVGHPYPGKGATTPDRLLGLVAAHPDNTVIAAHWGGGLPFYALMPEVAEAMTNLHFDCAASPLLYGGRVFTTVAALVGADRVLFGTDFPLITHRRMLRQIRESGLAADDQSMILGGNAERLLGLGGAPPI
jgi:predicted TIM-barrel fold metal-dependent hydrolase